jgi:hypothetical protein
LKAAVAKKLKSILTTIYESRQSEKTITELVHLSRTIISGYLINTKSSIIQLIRLYGLSLSDISYDCLGELFKRNEKGNYQTFTKFFSSLRTPVEGISEKELFFAFKGLLIQVTDAHIARLYSKIDPAGSKIQRNIKDTLPKVDFFTAGKNVNGIYLIAKSSSNTSKLPYIKLDNIERDFLSIANGKMTTKKLLKILYDIISEQQNIRKEIYLTDAVNLFKKIYSVETKYALDEEFIPDGCRNDYKSDEIEHNQIIEKVLNKVNDKIDVYLSKEKITADQKDALHNAVCDITEDWLKTGKSNSTLYEYINKYIDIDVKCYRQEIRDKLEYLVKLAKKEFSRLLVSNQ